MRNKIILVNIPAAPSFRSPGLGCLKAWALRDECLGALEMELADFAPLTEPLKIAGRILASRPGLVGFSCFVWNIHRIRDVVALVKQAAPDILIVLGGPEVVEPEETLRRIRADFVVPGEGEETFRGLLRAVFLRDGSIHDVPGLAFRGEGAIIRTPEPPLIDINRIPSLYQSGTLPIHAESTPHLEGSRGCLIGCSYCDWGPKKMRFISLDRLAGEFRFLAARTRRICMTDADILMHRNRGSEILRVFLEAAQGTPCQLMFSANPVYLNDEIVEIMAANPRKFLMEFGVQTITPETLKLAGRPFDRKRVETNLSKLRELAPRSMENIQLIWGLPGDTLEGFRRSLDWGLQFGCHVLAGPALVLPGTELSRQAKRLGIIHSAEPPYETLETPTMRRDDFRRAPQMAAIVNVFTAAGISDSPLLPASLHRVLERFKGVQAFRSD